jgi:hypothetical protein
MLQSRDELLTAIKTLPNRTSLLPKSYKEQWLGWLSEYEIPGFYGRKN